MPYTLKEYVNVLPRPLAKGLAAAIRERGGAREAEALQKFLQAYTRYGVLIDLARYAQFALDGRRDRAFETALSGWAKVGFGKWLEYARAAGNCLRRLEVEATLPDLGTRLPGQAVVSFTNRVGGKSAVHTTLGEFLGAAVNWRNADQHKDAVRQDDAGCAILREALLPVLEQSPALIRRVPIYITKTSRRRSAGAQTHITFDRLIGTGDIFPEEQDVPDALGVCDDTLYLADESGLPLFQLTPFLHWESRDRDLKVLDGIEREMPKYLSGADGEWQPPDLVTELRQVASFLFSPAPSRGAAPAGPADAVLAKFRKQATLAAEDGIITDDEKQKLSFAQEMLDIPEQQANAILTEVIAAARSAGAVATPQATPVPVALAPTGPIATSPPQASVTFRSPAPDTGHDGEVTFEIACSGFPRLRVRAEQHLIAEVDASPVTVVKRVFIATGGWRTIVAEGLDPFGGVVASATMQILPRDPKLSAFIQKMATTAGLDHARVAYALTDAAARFGIRAEVKANASLRIPDPAKKGREFVAFILSSDGRVYTGWLSSFEEAGYPAALGEGYGATLNGLAGADVESHGFGGGGVPLSTVSPWLQGFVGAISTLSAGIAGAAAVGIAPPGVTRAALALGLNPSALDQELTAIARRAVTADWTAARRATGEQDPPMLRFSKAAGAPRDGRVGVDVGGDSWQPGLFAGVLFSPYDHCAEFSRPELGADFVVIVSVTRADKTFEPGKFMREPEFTALRDRLRGDAGGWDLSDQLALPKNNLWHPIHLRRPVAEVFAGCASPEERYLAWLRAAHEGLNVLLRGGELHALRERSFGAKGAAEPPPTESAATTGGDAASPVQERSEAVLLADAADAGVLRPLTRLRALLTGRCRQQIGFHEVRKVLSFGYACAGATLGYPDGVKTVLHLRVSAHADWPGQLWVTVRDSELRQGNARAALDAFMAKWARQSPPGDGFRDVTVSTDAEVDDLWADLSKLKPFGD